MSKTVFLSTVTKEFGLLRRRLAGLIRRTGQMIVRHQDDFVAQGILTLHLLEEEIRKSDAVVHVFGNRAGSFPPLDQVEAFFERNPQFEQRFPEVAESARKGEVSYTQWEAWLALFFEKKLFPYVANERLPEEEGDEEDEQYASQRVHWDRLKAVKQYPMDPKNQDIDFESAVTDEVILSLINEGWLSSELVHKPMNLPYDSLGELFKGRDGAMQQLRDSLLNQSGQAATAIVASQTIHGLGGIGKTRLAVEYAWQYREDYKALLFVIGDTPEALRRNFADLCGPLVLNLPEKDTPEEEVRYTAAIRWLQKNTGWFLILDNLDNEDSVKKAEEVLGQLGHGHAILTSRIGDWSANVEALKLDVLAEEDAVDFLLNRTDARRRKTDDDPQLAAGIAEDLGHLALALEQAGAYISKRRMTFDQYRTTWNENREKAIEWFDERVMKYPESVATTWQTTFDQLSEPAQDLLKTLAWFSPEPIPESILESYPIEDCDAYDLLAELESWSIVA
ncbi:MAG: NB-ARC domain-containing protein, partial [Planctomycetota bacterium]